MSKWSEKKAREKTLKDFESTPKKDRKVSRPKVEGNEDDVASATKNEVDRKEALKNYRKFGRG